MFSANNAQGLFRDGEIVWIFLNVSTSIYVCMVHGTYMHKFMYGMVNVRKACLNKWYGTYIHKCMYGTWFENLSQ